MPDHISFPADWVTASVKDIVDPSRAITYGIVQPGPRFEPDRGTPMIRGQDYSSGVVRNDDLYYVDPRLAASFSRASVQGGDLLMSIVGYVGTVAEVPDDLAGANLTQTTARISVREDLKGRYFLHFLRSHYFKDEVKRFTKGSAQPGLNLADVEVMRVAYPRDASDRTAIAKVLDTLDIDIRQTEAIIAKLTQIKQGLLHDLLTRGIDANGSLRPPQSQAPHLYKDSPLGWIPESWEVEPLGRVIADAYRYPSYFGIDYVASGVPEVRGELIQGDGTLDPRADNYRYISKETAARFTRVHLSQDDIVMSVRGTIGKFALVPGRLEGAVITANLLKLTPNQSVVRADWLLRLLLSQRFQDALDAACSSTTIKTIQVPELMGIRIAVPGMPEQQAANDRLRAIDDFRAAERAALKKLKLQKFGLMDDLLTGRVRVTPLLP